jgi:hypothetical protein
MSQKKIDKLTTAELISRYHSNQKVIDELDKRIKELDIEASKQKIDHTSD